MSKFHINSKGIPAHCKATKGNCPFGGADSHYDTIEQAQKIADSKGEQEYGILPIENSKVDLEKEYNKIKDMISKSKDKKSEEALRTILSEISKDKNGGFDKKEVSLSNLFSDVGTPDGGATVSIQNSKVISPITGFCASPYPQYSKVFDNAEDVNYNALLDYIDNVNKQGDNLFEENDTYLGLWNDPETGKVYLDVSKRYPSAQEARIACEENDQIAYFDLQLFESVDVDRQATSGQAV